MHERVEAGLGDPVLGGPIALAGDGEPRPVDPVLRALDILISASILLWNVLRGDMAVVGPRPIRPAFFAELSEEIPQYWQRLVVRPGVTGFAQTRMTREESWADKLAHDMEYIADRSIGLYLSVLAATAPRSSATARLPQPEPTHRRTVPTLGNRMGSQGREPPAAMARRG